MGVLVFQTRHLKASFASLYPYHSSSYHLWRAYRCWPGSDSILVIQKSFKRGRACYNRESSEIAKEIPLLSGLA